MAKKTVLQFINEALDLAEFEQVTAITDSVESEQVLSLLNQVMDDIALEFWWDFMESDVTLIGLTTTGGTPYPIRATTPSNLTSITEMYKANSSGSYVKVKFIENPEEFRRRFLNTVPDLQNEPSFFTFQAGNTVLFDNAIASTFSAGNFLVKGMLALVPFTNTDETRTTMDSVSDNWDLLITYALKSAVSSELIRDPQLTVLYESKYNRTLTNLIERGVAGKRDENSTMELDFGKRPIQGRGYVDPHCPTYYR